MRCVWCGHEADATDIVIHRSLQHPDRWAWCGSCFDEDVIATDRRRSWEERREIIEARQHSRQGVTGV